MFSNSKQILVIDDEFGIRDGLKSALESLGYQVIVAESGERGIHEFRFGGTFLAVLTDFKMPGLTGIDVLNEIKKISASVPVIMMTGHGSIHHAVNAIQKGANDYLCKPFSIADLERSLKKIIKTDSSEVSETGLLTRDPKMLMILRKAERVARSDTPILIEGASGTGKELLARQIHQWSNRKDKPWVAVNCAALPAGLLESELFGFEKGAFTGAMEKKLGKFELADGGTLLLDEIGELDPLLQAKLLRVLQEGEIDRLGGRKPQKVDVRIIATTNRSLERLVKEDQFREDLYYRLYGVRFELTNLSDRPLDIPYLANHFLSIQSQELDRSLEFAEGVLESLQKYPWEGNVRELQRAVQRASVLSETGIVRLEHFEFRVGEPLRPTTRNAQDMSSQSPRALHPKGKPIKEMERETIIDALFAHNGNRTHTAKALGMSLRTLRHKLKQYKEDGFFVDGTRQNQIGNNGRVNLGDAELVPLTGQNAAGWEIAQLTRGEV